MTRYVIASEPADGEVELDWALDLPDAEHIHVTIRDGTITAVPMREAYPFTVTRAAEHMTNWKPLWVDAPGETP